MKITKHQQNLTKLFIMSSVLMHNMRTFIDTHTHTYPAQLKRTLTSTYFLNIRSTSAPLVTSSWSISTAGLSCFNSLSFSKFTSVAITFAPSSRHRYNNEEVDKQTLRTVLLNLIIEDTFYWWWGVFVSGIVLYISLYTHYSWNLK